jgi:hypothetical protein
MYNLKIIETENKKVKELIKTFNHRENDTANYIKELLKETLKHHYNCTKELTYNPAKPERYTIAQKQAMEAIFRLQYIAQCLLIRIELNWELYTTGEIQIQYTTEKN